MKTLKLRIKGNSALLMHSDRFANALDPLTKEHKVLTSKRKKTDEDYEAIAKSEFMGGMYHSDTNGPYLPGNMIKASIVNGAKLNRLGASFKRAVMVLEDECPLKYSGTRDKEELWADTNFVDCRSVVVGQSRLMRYRPKFKEWSTTVTIMFSPEMVEEEDIIRAAENAGLFVGVGDFRPQNGGAFGRYSVEKLS